MNAAPAETESDPAAPAANAAFAGHLSLRAAVDHRGGTVLAAQDFRAPFHLSKPYWDAAAGVLIVQVVNPTAGILGGDRLTAEIAVDAGAALLVTTPSAARIFTMRDGAAESRQRFQVAAGSWLEVAPEPLVPHRQSRFRQVTIVDVAAGGEGFFIDQLQPGRVAHRQEAWLWDSLCLETELRIAGQLVLRERLDQTGEELRALAAWAGSGPTACFANGLLIGGEADAPWRPAVHALHGGGLWVGLSALPRGGWSLRLVARDSIILRAGLQALRRILTPHFPRLAADARKL